jgi:amino acid transporter
MAFQPFVITASGQSYGCLHRISPLLGKVDETCVSALPEADAMLGIGQHWVAAVISAGAIAGLTTVILVLYFGLTRIFLAMSRDGLLPPVFSAAES